MSEAINMRMQRMHRDLTNKAWDLHVFTYIYHVYLIKQNGDVKLNQTANDWIFGQ